MTDDTDPANPLTPTKIKPNGKPARLVAPHAAPLGTSGLGKVGKLGPFHVIVQANGLSLSHMTPSPLMAEIMKVIRGQRRFQQDPPAPALPSSFLTHLLSFRIRRHLARVVASTFSRRGCRSEEVSARSSCGGRWSRARTEEGAESRDDKTMFYPKRDWVRSVMTTATPRDGRTSEEEMEWKCPKATESKYAGMEEGCCETDFRGPTCPAYT